MILLNNGTLLKHTLSKYRNWNAYGTVIAKPGSIYHWKFKVKSDTNNSTFLEIDIGFVDADKEIKPDWSYWKEGYAFCGYHGNFWNRSFCDTEYEQSLQHGDIVDVLLDLKNPRIIYGNHTEYTFLMAINGKKFKKERIRKSTNYRLAIAMRNQYTKRKSIEILSFDIDNFVLSWTGNYFQQLKDSQKRF